MKPSSIKRSTCGWRTSPEKRLTGLYTGVNHEYIQYAIQEFLHQLYHQSGNSGDPDNCFVRVLYFLFPESL